MITPPPIPADDDVVALSFCCDERDYVRAFRLHFTTGKFEIKKACFYCALAAAAGGVLAWTAGELRWLGLAFIAFALIALTLIVYLYNQTPRRVFRSDAKASLPRQITFSVTGVRFQTADIDAQLQWPRYFRAVVDQHSYLLYFQKNAFMILPTRAFTRPEQRATFDYFLQRFVPQIIRRG